jgi:hypothetical protein
MDGQRWNMTIRKLGEEDSGDRDEAEKLIVG